MVKLGNFNAFWGFPPMPMHDEPYFITPQKPGATIEPSGAKISEWLSSGFWAQRKVEGDRNQLHVSSSGKIFCFTKGGTAHSISLPLDLKTHLLQHYVPKKGWNVFDTEWQKTEKKLYFFDILKYENRFLSTKSAEQRHDILRGIFTLGPGISMLPWLKTLKSCLAVIDDGSPFTEGLVFKQYAARGFNDSSLARCRKYGVLFEPGKVKD